MNYRIERTGQRALAFDGHVLAKSEGRHVDGQPQQRYHDLTLYRTAADKLVLEIQYHTAWRGETGYAWAEAVGHDQIGDLLEDWQFPYVQGFPPIEKYARRQSNLLDWIARRFRDQVRDILAHVPQADEVIQ